MKRFILLLMLTGVIAGWAQSQTPRKEVRKGNRAYNNKAYDNAQAAYHHALSVDSTYYKAQYNLGDALYRQKQYGEAAQAFGKALQSAELSDKQRSQSFHNKGNSHLKTGLQNRENGMEHFQQAVESYKEALKLDPKNEDTRYNLSYAQKLLAQAQQQQQNQQGQGKGDDQQQQQQQGNDQQQNQQDQSQQNQNENQQGQSGEQQRQDTPNGQQQKQQQGQQDKKKQDAERLLEAVKNNERKTMKEQQKAAVPAKSGRIEKDW
ncbi:MAG: tetratricopeptide repeat protein [Bacteroidales bacterium]|nr:tetratricopeptide repeat protein [Bacteroidales bacterium]